MREIRNIHRERSNHWAHVKAAARLSALVSLASLLSVGCGSVAEEEADEVETPSTAPSHAVPLDPVREAEIARICAERMADESEEWLRRTLIETCTRQVRSQMDDGTYREVGEFPGCPNSVACMNGCRDRCTAEAGPPLDSARLRACQGLQGDRQTECGESARNPAFYACYDRCSGRAPN
jgi:hypothetical protein